MIEKIIFTIVTSAAIIGVLVFTPLKEFNFFKKEAGFTFNGNKALETFLKQRNDLLLKEKETLAKSYDDLFAKNEQNLLQISNLLSDVSKLSNDISKLKDQYSQQSNNNAKMN